MFKLALKPTWQTQQPGGHPVEPKLIELLRAIRSSSQITAARARTGLSYRAAQSLLQLGTATFGAPLVATGRNTARLTALGETVVSADERIRRQLVPLLDDIASELQIEFALAVRESEACERSTNPEERSPMNAIALRFYVHETRKHKQMLLFEWLLARAKGLGIHGGSAFTAVAGFGRHGIIHEQHLFDFAADLPVMIEFIVSDSEAEQLLALVRSERIHTFCTRTPTEVLVVNNF